MWRMIIFGLVTTTVWSLVHVYLGRHILSSFGLKGRARIAGWAIVAAHGVLAPIAMLVRRNASGGEFFDLLNLVTYLGMGFVALLFLVYLSVDFARLVAHIALKINSKIKGQQPDPQRREFLTGSFNLGAFALTGVATGVGFEKARSIPDIKEVTIEIPGLHANLDGFTIAQLSDIHIGPTLKRDFLAGVVDKTMTLNADMIAITGDSVDGYVQNLGEDMTELQRLSAPHGVYIVTGNHEYYFDGPAWSDFFTQIGLRTLNNAHQLVRVGRARLLIGGVTDYKAAQLAPEHATDPHGAMKNAPDHDFSILLAHQPTSVYEAAKAGWKLQLSGHTHGGQFFPFTLVIGLIHEFAVGIGKHLDTVIYVSRGTGYWGPPNRLGAPAEITRITLRRV